MRRTLGFFPVLLVLLAGCRLPSMPASQDSPSTPPAINTVQDSDFLSSGSIILSQRVPDETPTVISENKGGVSIFGYAPTAKSFLPATNEIWLKIDREAKLLRVYRGDEELREIHGEGDLNLQPGEYALQAKKENPQWYASDEYFRSRNLVPPPEGDERRFRKGALGVYALFPAPGFAIHSGAIWTKEVGGFRVDAADLAFIYGELEVGAIVRIE